MENLYDMIVIGGGPAGLSAAIYGARAKYRVLVLEKEKWGGQITITSEIVNYPGVEGTSGTILTQSMQKQAESFGAEFMMAEVTSLDLDKDVKVVHTTKGDFNTLGIILALGAHPRSLGFPGEKEYRGHGVAYCATCDGEFFTGNDVFVIGGGFAAAEEAQFLTRYAKQVHIIVREPEFTCARSIAEATMAHEGIEVSFNTEIVSVEGDAKLKKATFINNQTKETWSYEGNGFGIFVFAGYEPATNWLKGVIQLDPVGYIPTDPHHKTNIDGVYAAGDVCIKDLRQVVTAVSDGALAATSLEKYVGALRNEMGLPKADNKPQKASKQSVLKEESGFITSAMKDQLVPVFERFASTVTVKGYLNHSPLSKEMEGFMHEITALSEKVVFEKETISDDEKPYLLIGNNIYFHGVPGGHEFNSFIIALYNTAGPGQAIDDSMKTKIQDLGSHDIKVVASLSCTMCPEVVMASQRIASLNEGIKAHMYDLAHAEEYKDKYNIMSVPCIIVDDKNVFFGKHSLEELVNKL